MVPQALLILLRPFSGCGAVFVAFDASIWNLELLVQFCEEYYDWNFGEDGSRYRDRQGFSEKDS